MAVALDVSDGGREDGLGDGDAVDGDERLDVGFEDVRRRGEGVGGRRQAWDVLLPRKTVSGLFVKDLGDTTHDFSTRRLRELCLALASGIIAGRCAG